MKKVEKFVRGNWMVEAKQMAWVKSQAEKKNDSEAGVIRKILTELMSKK